MLSTSKQQSHHYYPHHHTRLGTNFSSPPSLVTKISPSILSPLPPSNQHPHSKWGSSLRGSRGLSINHNDHQISSNHDCGCYREHLASTAASNQVLPSPPPSSTPWLITASTRSTASPPSHSVSFDLSPRQLLYKGPIELPEVQHMRIYDCRGPVCFESPSIDGAQHARAELRQWPHIEEVVISQNSSKRKVHKGVWLSPLYPEVAFPVAVKFVEDNNSRDGRSIKREIECHLFIYQRLQEIQAAEAYPTLEDAWPSAELLGYHLDKKNPGNCMLVTRKLSGPDFFELIKESHQRDGSLKVSDELYKLHCCTLALKRVHQYARLGIRHNDIKPDNIVIDLYVTAENKQEFDVKIIDLGTASMHHAKDFTGGTAWYESPEQKILEFYSKKQRNPEEAKKVEIGLLSDVWAAGLSIAEVLVGKRVVDTLKQPNGPGPLDYRGPIDGWAVELSDWVQIARSALFSGPRKSSKHTYCYDAAKWIFDHLVKPSAAERASIEDAMEVLAEQSQRALINSRRAPILRALT